MTLPGHSSNESHAERIRELLAELPSGSPLKIALLQLVSTNVPLASVLGAPVSGSLPAVATAISGTIATWLGVRAQRTYAERIEEILWRMVEELDRLRISLERLSADEGWAELVCSILPLAARANTGEKRQAYAELLARGARRSSDSEREEARTMAALLEQVEYKHVKILSDLIRIGARSVTQDMFWGGSSEIPIEQSSFADPQAGASLIRLEAMGFIRLNESKQKKAGSLNMVVTVTELGGQFAGWVSLRQAA